MSAKNSAAKMQPLMDAACTVLSGRTTVALSVCLPHSRAEVWEVLTEPGRLDLWAPFTADRSLAHIGRATLSMLGGGAAVNGAAVNGAAVNGAGINGAGINRASGSADIPSVVFVADAPRSLEFSWADDTLSWTLEPAAAAAGTGMGTLLVLRQTLARDDMASAIAAGWHLCLAVMMTVLDREPIAPIRGMAAMDHGWAELNRRYAAMFGVAPTRVG